MRRKGEAVVERNDYDPAYEVDDSAGSDNEEEFEEEPSE